jgi:hypothetical protein
MIFYSSYSGITAMPIQIAQLIKRYGLSLCLPILGLSIGLAIALPVHAAPQVVGHISFVKGSNAAQLPGAAPRILGKDTEIFQGDNIQTTERSFVIIEFTDGAKVTVRPNSNFSIDHYDATSANKTAQLVLHEGGVNASTGDIAKGNPESFQIKTPTATVKPKSDNAEFNVRICDKACEEKGKEAAANEPRTEQSIVARVVDIKGEVNAINRADKDAKERILSLGKPLFNSDFISTEKDSYALMVFPDGEKITLQANSEMDIKQYHYQIKGKKDNVLFRLAAGGLRAMTGSIGKNDHSAFALDTPVATIGIRGTITDTYFNPMSGEFIHKTREGISFTQDQSGEHDVPAGFVLVRSSSDGISTITPIPANDPKPPEPAPESDKSDPKKVLEKDTPSNGDTMTDSVKGDTSVENNNGEQTKVQEGESGNTNDENGTTTTSSPGDTSSENETFNTDTLETEESFGNEPSNSLDGC